MSNAADRILRSIANARAFARGETTEGFVVHVPQDIDVKAIRTKLALSQSAFALRYGFSPASVRDWEQHRRQPEQAARVLLRVIDQDHRVVEKALEVWKTDVRPAPKSKPGIARARSTAAERRPAARTQATDRRNRPPLP